jgi:hypothetical protein
VNYTDYKKPIAPQLEGNGGTSLQDVFIIATHQYTSVPPGSIPPPKYKNNIPANYNFSYSSLLQN